MAATEQLCTRCDGKGFLAGTESRAESTLSWSRPCPECTSAVRTPDAVREDADPELAVEPRRHGRHHREDEHQPTHNGTPVVDSEVRSDDPHDPCAGAGVVRRVIGVDDHGSDVISVTVCPVCSAPR